MEKIDHQLRADLEESPGWLRTQVLTLAAEIRFERSKTADLQKRVHALEGRYEQLLLRG